MHTGRATCVERAGTGRIGFGWEGENPAVLYGLESGSAYAVHAFENGGGENKRREKLMLTIYCMGQCGATLSGAG